ncbi:50S ribosomal protein L1 [Candidatus Woesearchaeota archaeon]|nr:50S ribosomal protein L1 [Candidatus Woesearchaeota archaeon]
MKADLKEAVKKLRESDKRNFTQSVDIIINLKLLDLKKPEHKVDFFITLPKKIERKVKVCALVGPELADQARKVMDNVVVANDFDKYSKKQIKKLTEENDYFIAQATIMQKVATVFGTILGPRGKMPNPKAGCIVPPNANLQPVYQRLQQTIRLTVKNHPIIHTVIGTERMSDEELVENINFVYNYLIHHLPQGENNVKSIFIKYTMGKPVRIM